MTPKGEKKARKIIDLVFNELTRKKNKLNKQIDISDNETEIKDLENRLIKLNDVFERLEQWKQKKFENFKTIPDLFVERGFLNQLNSESKDKMDLIKRAYLGK